MVATEAAERLTAFLLDEVGDDLRVVVAYAGMTDAEVVYERGELLSQYSDEQLEQTIDNLVAESTSRSTNEGSFRLGGHRCTVRFFEHGVVLYLITGDGEGIAVSVDPAGLPDYAFLDDCLDVAAGSE